jgi:cytidylate kinase
MQMVFLFGAPASGKLTIGRLVAERTGMPLFHNHLVVDAVAAVFSFGSEEFVRLRESFWLQTISTAAQLKKSLIFTFAPEPTVAPDFPARVSQLVERAGGNVLYVALELTEQEQDARLVASDRAAFGKLRSIELLSNLRPGIAACMAAMPDPALRIDTGSMSPSEAADKICEAIHSLKTA